MEINELIDHAKNVLGEFSLSEKYFTAGSVSSALLTEKGSIYTGICVDIACGIGFCAEHSAIAEMLKNRETNIKMIVAINKKGVISPCGRCRELIIQIDKNNIFTEVIMDFENKVLMKDLLPNHWLENK